MATVSPELQKLYRQLRRLKERERFYGGFAMGVRLLKKKIARRIEFETERRKNPSG